MSLVTERLDRLGTSARRHPVNNRVLAISRTLIAVGTLMTFVFTRTDFLFYSPTPEFDGRSCLTPTHQALSYFCWVEPQQLPMMHLLSVIGLLLVITGYLPQITSILHWWITFSFFAGSNNYEGGDQIASILTLLLIPVCLCDRRWNHWQRPVLAPIANLRDSTATIVMYVIKIQVCVIYLHSALGKVAVAEWLNGTAVYYWLDHPIFGLSSVLNWALPFMSIPLVMAIATWGTVVVEFLTAVAIKSSIQFRWTISAVMLLLHVAFAMVFGLPAFSIIMAGALVLYAVRSTDFSSPQFIEFAPRRVQTFFSVEQAPSFSTGLSDGSTLFPKNVAAKN
ncbi:MAG: sporulation-delaying protein SdpB family protein [Leucobacter sp.]